MGSATGFDERLSRVFNSRAASAGESDNTYIQRAIIMRLVADTIHGGADDLSALRGRLAELSSDGRPDPSVVVRDPARVRALEATGLLDSPPDESYDRIVALAVNALHVPVSAITLVDRDRVFFKSVVGLPEVTFETRDREVFKSVFEVSEPGASIREAPLEYSVSQYAVASNAPLVVEDARAHPLLKNHPAVLDGPLVAYIGIPIIDNADHAIGTLCVWDYKPRQWGAGHVGILTDLAAMVHHLVFGNYARTI